MVKSVEVWLEKFGKDSQTPGYRSVPSSTTNPADSGLPTKTFPFYFEFVSIGVAVHVVMCWAVTAHLYSNAIQIHHLVQARLDRRVNLSCLLAQDDFTATGTSDLLDVSSQNLLFARNKGRSIQDIQIEGTRMARNVCQSLEYFHRIEMGTYGGHATTYPSWSARQYFRLHRGHEREWLWLQNIHKMEGPGTRWEVPMMTFADIFEPLGGSQAGVSTESYWEDFPDLYNKYR